jgi:hypothetical protein
LQRLPLDALGVNWLQEQLPPSVEIPLQIMDGEVRRMTTWKGETLEGITGRRELKLEE